MNETLILEGKNTDYTTSERFSLSTHANPAIDNIIVNDTITYDKAPPVWENTIADQQIVEGESFRYDINASDFSGIDSWWIDDTENFTIDENGVITNNIALSVGDYIIGVSVNDTRGNTQHNSFELSVVPHSISLPIEMILAIGGGTVVIIVILVIFIKRKS